MKQFKGRHSFAARRIRHVLALATAAALLATFAVAWATIPATASPSSHDSQVPEEVVQLMQDHLPKAAQFIATQGADRTGDAKGLTAKVRYIQPYYVIMAGDDDGYQAVDVGWIAAITIRGKPAGTASIMRDSNSGTITPYETTTNADVAACLEQPYREGGVFAELTRLHPYGYFMIKDGKVTPLNEESEHYITEAVSEDEFFDGLDRLSAWLDEASQLGSSAPDISSDRNVLVNPLEPLDTGTPVDAVLISAAFTLLLVVLCSVGLYRGIAQFSRRPHRRASRAVRS